MSYVLRRLGFYVVAFWASITLNFLLPRLMPGDPPVSRMFARMQDSMQPEQIDQLRRLFGLDQRPMWQQYLSYIGDMFTGNMGVSISRFPTPPVVEVIGTQIGWTILLGGDRPADRGRARQPPRHPRGLASRRLLDSVFPPLLVFVGSFPYFWLAMGALYLFGITLGWLPVRHAFTAGTTPGFTGEFIGDVATHLVLPALTIVLVSIGGWMLGMRNTMIATTAEDYITMAERRACPTAGSCSATPPATPCCPR